VFTIVLIFKMCSGSDVSKVFPPQEEHNIESVDSLLELPEKSKTRRRVKKKQ
jgi:hypothetical protein